MRHAVQPAIALSALLLTAVAAGYGMPVGGSADTAAAPSRAMPFEQAVVRAVGESFDAAPERIEVLRVDVIASNASQRELAAHGRVAFDVGGPHASGEPAWIPFDVAALYDVASASAVAQRLVLGGKASRPSTLATRVADDLSEKVSQRLQAEFPDQPARIELAGARAREVGRGLLAVEATGRTDFDGEGVAATSVHALYDPRSGRWLRVQYRLGGDDTGEAVAGL